LSDANSLNLRVIATKMLEQQFQPTPGQPFVDVVGQTGTSNNFLSDYQATAEWVANLYATWTRGPFSLTGQIRYVSSGEMNYYGITPGEAGFATAAPPLVTMSTNHVPSYEVATLSGAYTFNSDGPEVQVFAAINNLFDEEPPIATGTGFGGSANGGTNAVFYDTLGRSVRLGLRVNF
jgi:iron complex outermembrane receptor protein